VAQSHAIDAHVTAPGSVSTGGVYTLHSVIGQPSAGVTMTGGVYTLSTGFLALPIAVRVPRSAAPDHQAGCAGLRGHQLEARDERLRVTGKPRPETGSLAEFRKRGAELLSPCPSPCR
jgi:hypothetical protein